MSRGNKDSHEVAKFMATFARLKNWINDEPGQLLKLASQEPLLQELCHELLITTMLLGMSERQSRVQLATPVDPKFLSARREYQDCYESVVARAAMKLFDFGTQNQLDNSDSQWNDADNDARERAAAIEKVFEHINSAIDDDQNLDNDSIYELTEGIVSWGALKSEVGVDLRGVFRRRELIPFVLVPRNVAQKYGESETPSMLTNLRQAHDAFVIGAPYAALALMRSTLEVVLRDHYHAEGDNLAARIQHAHDRLPMGVNLAALNRLRELANAVLHLDGRKARAFKRLNEKELEKQIASLLLVLRNLIEGAA